MDADHLQSEPSSLQVMGSLSSRFQWPGAPKMGIELEIPPDPYWDFDWLGLV